MMTSKNPTSSAMTATCSATLPPSTPSSTHSPMPPAPSRKSAVDLQPMNLDCMKTKNPPQPCYNCKKLGHISQNCPEPHMHRGSNVDPLPPDTFKAIV